ncbi:MAG: hypothetical protein MJ054_00925 [Clostridia bacterium]|nr:hypothetical protein [Clostridia bacterium]
MNLVELMIVQNLERGLLIKYIIFKENYFVRVLICATHIVCDDILIADHQYDEKEFTNRLKDSIYLSQSLSRLLWQRSLKKDEPNTTSDSKENI